MTEPSAQRILRLLLIVIGASAVAALPAALMPQSWLQRAVEYFEPGTPVRVLVTYLARLTSLFYVLLGGVLLYCAADVRARLTLIRFIGAWSCCGLPIAVVFGYPLVQDDGNRGLLSAWVLFDAIFGLVFGLALLLLARGINSAPEGSSTGR